jgi:L,D-peptidoglycan transpeptidase YkuD (ErfK/YbiS/YcfS/YnhG family)
VGRTGLAPAGTKHEGDGKTPAGSFPVPFLFGRKPLPGVHLPYRRVTGPWDKWCDVPSDPHYNEWVDTRHVKARATESLPRYDYAAVIGYNRHPVVRGAGSAIFLHQSRGKPTIGCVSLPIPRLVQVLRWFRPDARPRIAIGVAGSLTRLSVSD